MKGDVKAEPVGNSIPNSALALNTYSVLTSTASGSCIPENVEDQVGLVNGKLLAKEAGYSTGLGKGDMVNQEVDKALMLKGLIIEGGIRWVAIISIFRI